MRYLIEPRDGIFVKGYGFSSFVKNNGSRSNGSRASYGKKLVYDLN